MDEFVQTDHFDQTDKSNQKDKRDQIDPVRWLRDQLWDNFMLTCFLKMQHYSCE